MSILFTPSIAAHLDYFPAIQHKLLFYKDFNYFKKPLAQKMLYPAPVFHQSPIPKYWNNSPCTSNTNSRFSQTNKNGGSFEISKTSGSNPFVLGGGNQLGRHIQL